MGKFYASFKENVDKSIIWSICHRGEKKGCHGDDNGNSTTTTFRFRYSIEIPMQRRSVRNVTCRDGGVISDTEFPHVGGKAKEEDRASDNSGTVQT